MELHLIGGLGSITLPSCWQTVKMWRFLSALGEWNIWSCRRARLYTAQGLLLEAMLNREINWKPSSYLYKLAAGGSQSGLGVWHTMKGANSFLWHCFHPASGNGSVQERFLEASSFWGGGDPHLELGAWNGARGRRLTPVVSYHGP